MFSIHRRKMVCPSRQRQQLLREKVYSECFVIRKRVSKLLATNLLLSFHIATFALDLFTRNYSTSMLCSTTVNFTFKYLTIRRFVTTIIDFPFKSQYLDPNPSPNSLISPLCLLSYYSLTDFFSSIFNLPVIV